MVGSVTSSSSSSRSSHGVDRFYHPPQKRQQQQQLLQQQQQQLLQQQQQQQRLGRPRARAADSAAELRETKNRVDAEDSVPGFSVPPGSNLDRFMAATSPVVKLQHFTKKGTRGVRQSDTVYPYFNIADLSDAYAEWSAYGAGVPLVLNENDVVVQYYVPYLSGIQLYARDPNVPLMRARHLGDNSDGEIYRDTSSESSTDCGVDRRSDCFRESAGRQQLIEHVNRLSVGDKGHGGHEIPNADNGDAQKDSGILVFEYLERDSPYARQPIAEKLSNLVCQFPDLKRYKSCDLRPGSWLSVAWYPIYRIPTGPTLKDLDACFLTFHLLSTPLKSMRNGHVDLGSSTRRSSSPLDFSLRSLPTFGLASYKFKDSIWYPNGINEQQQAASLQQTADAWLKKRQVELPDFRFFMSHGNFRR